MNGEKFISEIEARLTSLAPEMIPGLIKKQMENLSVGADNITPAKAVEFIENVSKALVLFIGPEGSKNAKKLMMRKLRQNCSEQELEGLILK